MFVGIEDNWLLLLLVLLWTLPWKGVALWRAAHREEKRWFVAILVLNTLAILEIVYIFFVAKDRPKKRGDKLAKARAKIQANKRDAKKKILKIFAKKRRIVNDDVQKLLGVSDATATRYLDELEKDNKIVQKGSKKGVFYTLKQSSK